MGKQSKFNRCRPLLERKHVPCEVISIDHHAHQQSSPHPGVMMDGRNLLPKRHEYFTLRILEGHRTNKDHGRIERAIRLEISDEYRGSQQNKLSNDGNNDDIPFSPSLRHRSNNIMFNSTITMGSYRQTNTVNHNDCCPTGNGEFIDGNSDPVQLYELEVGESDFAVLQQDQALLVDFANFSNSFIHLLSLCDLGIEDGAQVSNQSEMGTSYEQSNKENDVGCCGSNMHHNTIPNNPLLGCQLSATSGMIGQSSSSFRSPNPTLNKVPNITDKPVVGSESMYTCRIEEYSISKNTHAATNSWNNSTHKNGSKADRTVRFSIVESNQFRELTHLSLNLSIGSDASIKSYLSLRLHETIGSIAMLKHKLNRENIRATHAEQSCTEAEKRFNEVVSTTQEEKNALVNEADETIQKQNAKMLEEIKVLRETSRREIQGLKCSFESKEGTLKSQIEDLERVNRAVETERTKLNEKNMKLTDCLQEQETISEKLSLERNQISVELLEEKNQRKILESQLHEARERLTLLEENNTEKGGLLNQMEETIKKSSQEAQEAHAQSETCALRLHTTEQELGTIKVELSQTKELLSRYQSDRQEMKRRMKSKVDIIQKQEEILASHEIHSTETHQRMERSEKELQNARHEMERMKRKLDEAEKTIEENGKTLENNQQVGGVPCIRIGKDFFFIHKIST